MKTPNLGMATRRTGERMDTVSVGSLVTVVFQVTPVPL